MQVTIPYGTTKLCATLDWAQVLATLSIAETPPLVDPVEALLKGLDAPIGQGALAKRLRPGGTVLIIVSDSFRKTGVNILLPTLLSYLHDHGIPDENIAFLFATGTHRAPTAEEQGEILGRSVYERFKNRAYSHDAHDKDHLVYRGDTRRGTPIYVNRRTCDVDTVIATGTVVLHYFGGFGGGRKSIVPGIAGTDTIAANHALNLDPVGDGLNPDVAIGRTVGNPVAEDMLEGALRCAPAFLINTILNRDGAVSGIYCGDLEQAHDAACTRAGEIFTIPIAAKADFVVASAGAAKNFIQSHKSLFNAFQAVKASGLILLATPASEGYGGNRFLEWLELGSREAIIAALRKQAEINGQTALSTLEKAPQTLFVTEMSALETRALGGEKVATLAEGLAMIRSKLSERGIEHPTCYIMPDAAYTVPMVST